MSTEENLGRYRNKTAEHGIIYLLKHDYSDICLEVVDKYPPTAKNGKGLHLLEFGCGVGLNPLQLVSALERRGMAVDFARCTDSSEAVIESGQDRSQGKA